MKNKYSVLFVCLGNICRSPAGEGVLKEMVTEKGLADEWDIDSAGLGSWHVGQLPDERMRKQGLLHGYVFNSRARVFRQSDFDRFDCIVAMDDDIYRQLRRKAVAPPDLTKVHHVREYFRIYKSKNDVPDPYYGDQKDFEYALCLIEDACNGIFETLTGIGSRNRK